ncbi:MAG: hypothetical protein WCF65_02085 [Parachlamydiaceae bacterium]
MASPSIAPGGSPKPDEGVPGDSREKKPASSGIPSPKLEHFFLDNTMLMIPIEEAIRKWKTFFEPTFEEFKLDHPISTS